MEKRSNPRDQPAPTFTDVLRARRRIRPHLSPTPLYRYPALSRLAGAEIWVKHENHQPTGAFKVRGGINLVSQLSDAERERGLCAASTGNHGQSIAYAARLFNVPALIVVPEGANPVKVEAMEDFGAQVIFHGKDYDDARLYCEGLAREHGYRYVHSGDEPLLIAGVATHTLEILEDRPDIDVIVVPVGGGSGAAGACIVANAIRSDIEVIGVQSEAAPAAYTSWHAGRLIDAPNTTIAEGLATRTAFELPQRVLQRLLNDFVLVSDADLMASIKVMIASTRNLVEAAGAASLAGALKMKDRIQGKRVALICSGGNISPTQLAEVLAAGEAGAVREPV